MKSYSNMTSQNHKWSHISSDISFIKKIHRTFFSIKFPIEWPINEVSMIILKFFKNWIFNEGSKSIVALHRSKKSKFSKKKFTGFPRVDGSTDLALTRSEPFFEKRNYVLPFPINCPIKIFLLIKWIRDII